MFCIITIVYSESHTQPQNTFCGKEVIAVLQRIKREMCALQFVALCVLKLLFLLLQSFLMGQKLHSITFHEDHEVLNKNLTPDSDPSLSDHDGSGMLIACIGISKFVRMPKMI